VRRPSRGAAPRQEIRGFETSAATVTETTAALAVSASENARTAIVLCAARPLAVPAPGEIVTLAGTEVLDAVDAGG
jgi:hypothetical protein